MSWSRPACDLAIWAKRARSRREPSRRAGDLGWELVERRSGCRKNRKAQLPEQLDALGMQPGNLQAVHRLLAESARRAGPCPLPARPTNSSMLAGGMRPVLHQRLSAELGQPRGARVEGEMSTICGGTRRSAAFAPLPVAASKRFDVAASRPNDGGPSSLAPPVGRSLAVMSLSGLLPSRASSRRGCVCPPARVLPPNARAIPLRKGAQLLGRIQR